MNDDYFESELLPSTTECQHFNCAKFKMNKLLITFLIGFASALVQEYNSCDNSFDCPSYCQRLGFSNGVCKVLTVDESTQLDGTKLGNRKLCLCDDQSMFYVFIYKFKLINSYLIAEEWFRYFFSPGHNCVRNGDESSCREYCKRIRIDEDYCRCRLSSCSFPKLFVKPARIDIQPVVVVS